MHDPRCLLLDLAPTIENVLQALPVAFSYDAPASGWAEQNLQYNMKGQLALESRSTPAGSTGTLYSYDLNGNVIANYECEPSGCGNAQRDQSITYGYDLSGNLTSESDGAGVTYTYGRSVAGQITGITSSLSDANDPANIVVPGSVQNGPFGPTDYVLGNGANQVTQIDGLGRITGGSVCSNHSTALGCGGSGQLYGYTSTWLGTHLTASTDTVNQSRTYGYDEFNRLQSMNVNSGQQTYQYVYDRWGNRTQQNAPQGGVQSQLAVDITTNRITGNGLSTFTYDPAGNLTSDGTYTYTYDADGNMTAVARVSGGAQVGSYIYDALNRRVHILSGGGTFEFAFDQNGQRVSTWIASNGAFSEGLVYWDGRPIAFRSGGATHFQHQDWLGTERAGTSSGGTVEATVASLPYGDGYTTTGIDWDWYHFAGTDHDAESGSEHATFRQLSSTQGRWMSPDPYQGSYDASNPQSLNRYSYALNNPFSFLDPSGLDLLCVFSSTYYPANGSNGYPSFLVESQVCQEVPSNLPGYGGMSGGSVQTSGGGGASGGGGGSTPAPNKPAPSKGFNKQAHNTCLNNFNQTGVGKVTNFFSLASPLLGPERLHSTVEDLGGSALKYGAYTGLRYLENNSTQVVMALGSGVVADIIHFAVADIVAPVAAVSTGLQVGVHAACAAYSTPSLQPYLPPTF